MQLPMSQIVSLMVACLALVAMAHAYGESNNGLPTYAERTLGSLINAARLGPSQYAAVYMVPAGYPASGLISGSAQPPIYFDPLLGQTSHGHSDDLATNCHAVQFESCDGAMWYDRILSRYPCGGGYIGMSLQYAYDASPIVAVNDGLCGWNQDSDGNYVCCPASGVSASGESCDGMRNIYFSSTPSRFGVGYGFDSLTGLHYWTVDYGTCTTETYTNLIASGSHIIRSGNVRFIAQFYDPLGAPITAQVFIGGVPSDLQVDVGVDGQGNYYFESAVASSCRSYYFQFISAAGGYYRYPETGYFSTYGEGDCASDWSDEAVGPTTATAPGVPQNVRVSGVTASTATISWDAPATNGGAAITSYSVYISGYNGGSNYNYNYNLNGFSQTFTGLASGFSWTGYVVATSSAGTSAHSTTVSFITQDNYPYPSMDPVPSASPSSAPTKPPGVSASPSRSPIPPTPAASKSSTPAPSRAPAASASPSHSPAPGPACQSASCLPQSFNWHQTTGCFSGMLDQAQCGSCYAFCVASGNSDRICWAQRTRIQLSPQEILDCGKGQSWFGYSGCDGGDSYRACQLLRDRGYPTASDTSLTSGCRPYRCYDGNCASSPYCNPNCDNGSSATKYRASSAYRLIGTTNIMLDIYNNGPVNAGFDICWSFYDFFNNYNNRGKVYTTNCSPSSSDYAGGHAISIMGWGTDQNGVDYWLIQNSWSAQWGDNGYFRMKRGVNHCNIENYVSAAGITRTNKRFGAISVREDDEGMESGVPVTLDPSNDRTVKSTKFALDLWHFANFKDNFKGNLNVSTSGKRQGQQPVGALTTGTSYSVSSVNSATAQVTSGSNIFVDFVATDGINSVNLVSTIHYSAASGGAASAAGVSAASGGSTALSTGAIIGIVIGATAGAILLAGLTTVAVVGAVAVYKRRQANNDFSYGDQAMEMEALGSGSPAPPPAAEEKKAKRSTWFERRKLFQSITGRSPPIRVDS